MCVFVWDNLIPVGFSRSVIVSCDDDTVSPILLLSEDQKTEAIGKILLVLNILSKIGRIFGEDSTIGEGDRCAGLIERNVNILAIEKVSVITSIIAKIELWVSFASLRVSGLVLTNLIFPKIGERVLTLPHDAVIISSNTYRDLPEEIVKGFVKGILKNDLFSLISEIVRRRMERHILGGVREVGSRHYN